MDSAQRAVPVRRGDSPAVAARRQRRAGLFRSWVALFDDPILLCGGNGGRAHHCDSDVGQGADRRRLHGRYPAPRS